MHSNVASNALGDMKFSERQNRKVCILFATEPNIHKGLQLSVFITSIGELDVSQPLVILGTIIILNPL